MKFIFVLPLSLMLSRLVSGIEYYPTTYDNIDVDTILNSERLLNQYMACILDKGPCTADGRSLRRILPEAMATNCEKCTVKQRQIAGKISSHLKHHKPEVWATFVEKYDPSKQYVATFEKFLAQVKE